MENEILKRFTDEEIANMSPFEEWIDDDVMTIENFEGACKDMFFTDYDGFGCLALKDRKSEISISPSEILSGNYDERYTHIVWYNK